MMRPARLAALVLLASAGFAGTGVAQARGEITGTVTDSAKVPLAEADVFLRSSGRRVRTDSAGVYRFANLSNGSYTLIARKIGYKFEEADVVVRDGATTRQDFIIARRVMLPGVRVTAKAECPLGTSIVGFFCRQERAAGLFLDYPEIDYYGHTYTADLFRYIRGFRVETHRTPAGWLEPRPVRSSAYCTIYLVDGQVVNGWESVPVNTRDVTAMEIYVRPDTAPSEVRREMLFGRAPGGGNPRHCDAVVIWTRRAGG